jgi:type VII secretion integral membrane protein EccD
MDAAEVHFVPSRSEKHWRRDPPRAAVTVIEVSVSRVCIHADRNGDPVAVDVILPSEARVGELLPTIVEIVDGRPAPDDTARRWRLHRPSGAILDHGLSLNGNGIRDGELLVLDADCVPRLGPVRRAACQQVATVRPTACHLGEFLPGAVCVVATLLAAAVLAWTVGSEHALTNAIIAGVGAAVAAVAAVATGHPTASSITVVALAWAAGFLAVPSGPAAPNVFLASTAALSASLLMIRLSGRASPALATTATLSLLVAVVTPVAMPGSMAGAALTSASLVTLALAPRLSVLAAGLGPQHWHGAMTESATAGHAILGGLVGGCAAGTAVGAVVIAAVNNPAATNPAGAIVFIGLAAMVLLLRSRIYVDAERQITLIAGGFACSGAGLYLAATAHPVSDGAVACALVVIGLIAVRRPRCGTTVARLLDRLEYAALAAVVPVACWVGGVYAVVDGFHLP